MLVLSAHIKVASIELLGMQSVTDTPSEIIIPPNILEKSKDERKEVLDHVVGVIINTYVDINTVKYKTPQTSDSDTEARGKLVKIPFQMTKVKIWEKKWNVNQIQVKLNR